MLSILDVKPGVHLKRLRTVFEPSKIKPGEYVKIITVLSTFRDSAIITMEHNGEKCTFNDYNNFNIAYSNWGLAPITTAKDLQELYD